MTDTKLHPFEGRDIDRATVKIVGAGDGLSEALGIAPDEIELDDERSFVLRGSCSRVSIETDKNGVTSRVHTIKTDAITMVDGKVAAKLLAEAADELAKAKAAAQGQLMLDAEQAAEAKEALD